MKKYIIIIVILIVCLIPIKTDLKDGGTKVYSAVLYNVVKYNQLDGEDPSGDVIKGRHDTVFHIFPFNFIMGY